MHKLIALLLAAFLSVGAGTGDLDGANDYYSVSGSTYQTNDTTIIQSVVWDSLADTHAEFAGTYSWSDINTGFNIMMLESTNKVRFYRNTTSGWVNVEWSTSPTVGTWYHLAYQFDDTANVLEGFVDNVSVGTNGSTAATNHVSSISMHVGAYGATADQTRYHNGKINYTQVFNVSLTEGERQNAHWYPGSIARGLIGYWPHWGLDPSPDLSGNGNDLTVNGVTASNDGAPAMLWYGVPL